MNAAQKIQHLTGRKPTEVREWAFVYWVHFAGQRPTFYSKKIVDRAAQIQVIRKMNGDAIVRDTRTGKAYATRANFHLGHSIMELAKGTAINLDCFDYSMLKGSAEIQTGYIARPRRVSEIISCVVRAA